MYSKANNPFEIYNLLQGIKIKTPNNFINIAPLGTKPMALGACLFALHNPAVRIIYPLPDAYESKYGYVLQYLEIFVADDLIDLKRYKWHNSLAI